MYEYLFALRYIGIFVLMMIFPSESVMPLAGHLASVGAASLWGVIACGMAGSTVGSLAIYAVSRWMGQDVLDVAIVRYGKWFGLSPRRVERAGKWFDRHAVATVFVGRFVPGVRSAVSVPAGIRRMPLGIFVLYTALGSGVWIACLTFLGYSAHAGYVSVQKWSGYVTTLVGIVVVIGVIVLVAQRHRS